MSLKSIVKLYSIPILIVILGIFLYFVIFAELNEKKLSYLYTQYKHNKSQSAQNAVDVDSQNTHTTSSTTLAQTHNAQPEIILTQPIKETPTPQATQTIVAKTPQTTQEITQDQTPSQANTDTLDTLPQAPQQIPQIFDTPQIRYVHVRSANIRTLPNINSEILYKAYTGQQLLLVQNIPESEWSEVEVDSKIRGYIASYLLSTNPPQENTQNTNVISKNTMPEVIVKSANIRALPSPNAPVITTLKLGQNVQVLQDDGEWSKILLGNGREGYIASRLLSKF
ncbi:SH3 domain-containing protein [Helicobacter sp.]|uniref:SH3 domain-containing protein n=1 Tax=Helicobacter sp. TaxID=218 RepID=UPI002A7A7312|nr:SH3 domain-containing protein [Helicobacter sp.]MDY2823171.1 SH3 domain-containing protein [Helicobacter sp.]